MKYSIDDPSLSWHHKAFLVANVDHRLRIIYLNDGIEVNATFGTLERNPSTVDELNQMCMDQGAPPIPTELNSKLEYRMHVSIEEMQFRTASELHMHISSNVSACVKDFSIKKN